MIEVGDIVVLVEPIGAVSLGLLTMGSEYTVLSVSKNCLCINNNLDELSEHYQDYFKISRKTMRNETIDEIMN